MKQIKPGVYERLGLRAFYKSYNSWELMTGEQRNKAVAYSQNAKYYGRSSLCPCCLTQDETLEHVFSCLSEETTNY
jgi:hypothetical protein